MLSGLLETQRLNKILYISYLTEESIKQYGIWLSFEYESLVIVFNWEKLFSFDFKIAMPMLYSIELLDKSFGPL